MFEKYFLYFFRRLVEILVGIYSDPWKLTVFCLLLLLSAVLSAREYRKDREGRRYIGGRVFSNTLWLSVGLGLPIACVMGAVGSCLRFLRMERLGQALIALGKYVLYPFKYHLVERRHVESDRTTTFWTVAIGFWTSALEALLGLFYCLTFIGIPFGLKHLRLAIPIWAPCNFRILSDVELEELMETSRGR